MLHIGREFLVKTYIFLPLPVIFELIELQANFTSSSQFRLSMAVL